MPALTDAQLPVRLPVLPGVMVTGRYLMTGAEPVSRGDTLDAISLPGRRIALMVADVVGAGVGAGVAAAQIRAVMRERLLDGAQLSDAMASVDRYAHLLTETCAATACVALVGLDDGHVEYAVAGHPAPLVVEPDGLARSLPCGPSRPFGTGGHLDIRHAQMGPEDMIALYTDGLVNSRESTPAAGRARLLAAARAASATTAGPLMPPAQRGDAICEEILANVVPQTGCIDDVALVLAARTPSPQPLSVTIEARVENLKSLHRELDLWLDQVGAGLLDHIGLGHAVSELTSNVVRHAYAEDDLGTGGRPLSVHARLEDDGTVSIAVIDRGHWRPSAHEGPGGRGLMMAAGLADGFRVHRRDTGTVVELTQALGRPVPLLQAVREEPRALQFALEEWEDELTTEVAPGRLVARGRVDDLATDLFHDALYEATSAGTADASVDLSGVSHLGSPGVQALFDFWARSKRSGVRFDLVALAGSPAHEILDLVDLPHSA